MLDHKKITDIEKAQNITTQFKEIKESHESNIIKTKNLINMLHEITNNENINKNNEGFCELLVSLYQYSEILDDFIITIKNLIYDNPSDKNEDMVKIIRDVFNISDEK